MNLLILNFDLVRDMIEYLICVSGDVLIFNFYKIIEGELKIGSVVFIDIDLINELV